MARLRLGDILLTAGVIDQAGLERALNEQKRWGDKPLGQYLVQLNLISEETLVRALSKQLGLPAVAIDPERVDPDAVLTVPKELCQRHRLVCFAVDREKRFASVAMADPSSMDAVDQVRAVTGFNVRPFFALPSAIDATLAKFFVNPVDALGTIDLGEGFYGSDGGASPSFPENVATPPPPPSEIGAPISLDPRAMRTGGPLAPIPSEESVQILMDVPVETRRAAPPAANHALETRVVQLEEAIARQNDQRKALIRLLLERGLIGPGDAKDLGG